MHVAADASARLGAAPFRSTAWTSGATLAPGEPLIVEQFESSCPSMRARERPPIRVTPPLLAAAAIVLPALLLGGCGENSEPRSISAQRARHPSEAEIRAAEAAARAAAARRAAARRAAERPIVSPVNQASSSWQPVATLAGRVAAWQAQRSGVTLLRFDQHLVRLRLHAGLGEPSGRWAYGDRIEPSEIHRIVSAFNGGFKFSTGVIGFMADGRVAVPLQSGLGSIVTYRDGTTEIGAWRAGVPARGRPISSVLQNLHLLVDQGTSAAADEGCVQACWGETLGGGTAVARSALGIRGDGELIWAGGESLTPADIAEALVRAGAQRAVELDINPAWVAAYLYVHTRSGPHAVPVVPSQNGIAGEFFEPYSRDFFTITAR